MWHDDVGYSYFHDEPDAPMVECPRCGRQYKMAQKAMVDTWNLGHYGCTFEKCPRRDCSWVDLGCVVCRIELDQILSEVIQKTKREFWGDHYRATEFER